MAKFAFNLQPLLDHRRHLEDQAQRGLAQLLRTKLAIETQLRNQQQAISDDKRRMAGGLTGHVDVGAIRRHAAHVGRAAVHAQQMALRLYQLTREIEQARRALANAMKQRKAVEVLRDRQYRRWQEDEKRRETAELDEIAVQNHARRQSEVIA